MNIPILFEDDSILVIDKPAGVVTDRSDTQKEKTVQDWAEENVQGEKIKGESEQDRAFRERGGIVHRLDKETTGCLIIAKTPQAYTYLQDQFKARTISKAYIAIVHGHMAPEVGEIRVPVGRLPWNRQRFGVLPGGKEAVTKYTVRSTQHTKPGEPISVVELFPQTGRTHQIRVHLKHIGHPIVGDFLYAGRKTSRNDRVWVPRVMLHAQKISFTHPSSGKALAIEAAIPDDMKRIIGDDNSTDA